MDLRESRLPCSVGRGDAACCRCGNTLHFDGHFFCSCVRLMSVPFALLFSWLGVFCGTCRCVKVQNSKTAYNEDFVHTEAKPI